MSTADCGLAVISPADKPPGVSIQYSMYFGTENIPLSSSGGNLLQYLTSLMITFWIYPGYNLFQLVTLDWITADRLQQLLQGNHHKKDKY